MIVKLLFVGFVCLCNFNVYSMKGDTKQTSMNGMLILIIKQIELTFGMIALNVSSFSFISWSLYFNHNVCSIIF